MRTNDDLTKLVNQSGFPLQMAIEDLVATHGGELGWKVRYVEHGWRSDDGQSGFIDLVLEDANGSMVLVLETKRVQDADWVFLNDSDEAVRTSRARIWITNTEDHGKAHFGYLDVDVEPHSFESMFCVVAGQDSKSRPMLERLAAELTASTEALADEERAILENRRYGLRMYAPVIVTTARLTCSSFSPSLISLEKGEIADAAHQEVSWVRFRKHLSSETAVENPSGWDFDRMSSAKEKSVFVVNASKIKDFLTAFLVSSASLRSLKR